MILSFVYEEGAICIQITDLVEMIAVVLKRLSLEIKLDYNTPFASA